MKHEESEIKTYQDGDLLYAATARCRCGAGLAYPLDVQAALELRAWYCSAILKGEVPAGEARAAFPFAATDAPHGHDVFPFAFYKVREETSINNDGAHTTRPSGSRAMTVGRAECPKCGRTWESEPYIACGLGHHWFSGPCPDCGYAVGAGGSYTTDEGKPIEVRYADVVLTDG